MGWYSTSNQWQVLRERARKMRRAPTPAETVLWEALRRKGLGVNFRRQHPIGPYVADFFSPEARLIVEVDGEIHNLQQLEDAERQGNLESIDFQLLRFTNAQVLKETESVVEEIRAAVLRLGNRRRPGTR